MSNSERSYKVFSREISLRVSSDSTYRLSGNWNEGLSIQHHSSKEESSQGPSAAFKTLDKSALTIDEQGNFSIKISPGHPRPGERQGDWLLLAADHTRLSILVNFLFERRSDHTKTETRVNELPLGIQQDTVSADWDGTKESTEPEVLLRLERLGGSEPDVDLTAWDLNDHRQAR